MLVFLADIDYNESYTMSEKSLGIQISETRKRLGFTQAELADKCYLNIRTVQRIEAGKVSPRMYTIRIINEALGTEFKSTGVNVNSEEQFRNYRTVFKRRKKIRIITAISALVLLIVVVLLSFPDGVLFGLPKRVWAPFIYLIMFGHIIGIALTWRCPGCNGILGDVFNTRFCPKCGLKFYD